MKTNNSSVQISNDCFIDINITGSADNVLIVGNTTGFFGYYKLNRNSNRYDLDDKSGNLTKLSKRIIWLKTALENGTVFTLVGNDFVIEYYQSVFMFFTQCCKFKWTKQIRTKVINDDNELGNFMSDIKNKGHKFDYIIQNPPYSKSLHLDFFKNGLEMLSENGRMVIIEPATWLINVRKNGKAKLYSEIKELVKGHVKSVKIENLNKEFGTGLYVPFAITEIDYSNEYKEIECNICGEVKKVSSLYDVNLVGNYDLVWSIFDKVKGFKDMMSGHITKEIISNMKYLPYKEIITNHGFDSDVDYIKTFNGEYYGTYITPAIHKNKQEIYDEIGKTDAGNPNPCVYGTQSELQNWKHFIFNNKIPLFLNICLTINQNNNSKEFLPWLVDKQYTDTEINSLFNFTQEEINFIDYTVEKFEHNSPWFKRYMCGPTSVSDEDVNTFITNLKKKYNITD